MVKLDAESGAPESSELKAFFCSLYFRVCWFVGKLLNVPATYECTSGTDLLRQFYVLPH